MSFDCRFFGLRGFSGFQHSGVYILFAFQSCCFTVVLYCFVFVKTKNVTYQGFYKQEKILRQVDVFNLDDSCRLHQAYTRLRGHVVEMRLYDYNL